MPVQGLVPRVLLVDPHLISREGTRALFASCVEVELVGDTGDGNHALTLCEELRPDVVVIDVDMQSPTAPQLTLRMKCREAPPAVVVLASKAEATMMSDAFAAGASAFVLRDRGFKRLVDAVVAVARGDVLIDVYTSRDLSIPQARSDRPTPDSLSARELQTLQLMASGLSTKQIASTLHLSPKTVETHRAHIYSKLNIDSLVGLTKYAISHGLASVE